MLSSQILSLDPLVSDTACHTRAPYLIYLARKNNTSKLSQKEMEYLTDCDILTKTKFRLIHYEL